MTARYEAEYRRSLADPDGFWGDAAAAVDWTRPPATVLERRGDDWRWFPDGMLNTCWNALDRHIDAGRGEQTALVHDSPVTGTVTRFTYRALRDRVAALAGALVRLGVESGDRVVIYMPMVPEAAIAMLACARIGAVHSVVFGGFAPPELAARIDDAAPKVVLSASCGIEAGRIVPYKPMLDRAIDLATAKPERCVILQRPQVTADLVAGRDLTWEAAVADAAPRPCTPVPAGHALYILYTSGATGRPKGVVRDHGGHAVGLSWAIANIYGLRAGDTMFTASDVGWVGGHCFIVYGPLMAGATTVLYEGKPVGTPDAGAIWRVAAEQRVNVLFIAPTGLRAMRREDPQGRLRAGRDLSALRAIFVSGERADPPTVEWTSRVAGVPLIDHYGQTESAWPMVANFMGLGLLPIKAGSPTRPVPGWRLRCLRGDGGEAAPGEAGALVAAPPLPPGALVTLWNADARFREVYFSAFPGHYQTGDAARFDADGYVEILGRTDDIIIVAGHSLSTVSMEEALAGHPDVAECAVIGVADAIKGQVPLGVLVLKAGVGRDEAAVAAEAVQRVRDSVGPVAALREVLVVERLPKTRSGKILRATMRAMADGRPWTTPATAENPDVLDEIAAALAGRDR